MAPFLGPVSDLVSGFDEMLPPLPDELPGLRVFAVADLLPDLLVEPVDVHRAPTLYLDRMRRRGI